MIFIILPNKGIKDWGVSQSTLEDVFLSIVRGDEMKE